MTIDNAGAYCRQNYASLASIHSYAEQQQVRCTSDHHR